MNNKIFFLNEIVEKILSLKKGDIFLCNFNGMATEQELGQITHLIRLSIYPFYEVNTRLPSFSFFTGWLPKFEIGNFLASKDLKKDEIAELLYLLRALPQTSIHSLDAGDRLLLAVYLAIKKSSYLYYYLDGVAYNSIWRVHDLLQVKAKQHIIVEFSNSYNFDMTVLDRHPTIQSLNLSTFFVDTKH